MSLQGFSSCLSAEAPWILWSKTGHVKMRHLREEAALDSHGQRSLGVGAE